MFISVLVTFASTTLKIYLELSEHELFERMKGIVAIVSKNSIFSFILCYRLIVKTSEMISMAIFGIPSELSKFESVLWIESETNDC